MIVSPGDLIGARYRVELLIRDGRASTRFLGLDTKTKKPVSIEIVVPSSDEADAVGVRFLASARRAANLVTPHVARVLDAGVTSDGHPFVITEAPDGETIARALELRGSAPTAEAIDVAIDICEALAEGHASGLLHGDLTTECVQIAPVVKVAGIGTTHTTLGLRASDELGIRAPEQLDPSTPIDPRTDVWGVGVILYTMLAGGSPFASDSPSNQNVSLALDEPPQLAGVPDALADVVDACLSKNPVLRPHNIKSLAEELAAFASDPAVAAARVASWQEVAPESSPTVITVAYEALRREKEAALVEDSADSTAPRNVLTSMPPAVREMMKSEPPPPVVRTLPPAREVPTVVTPRRKAKWQLGMHPMVLVGASACIIVASVIAASIIRRDEVAPPVAAAVAPPPPAPPPPEPREAPPPPVVAVIPATALPEAPATAPAAAPPVAAKRVVMKKADAKTSAPSASPNNEKPQQPAPEPKASDDDLRKFLDDRR